MGNDALARDTVLMAALDEVRAAAAAARVELAALKGAAMRDKGRD